MTFHFSADWHSSRMASYYLSFSASNGDIANFLNFLNLLVLFSLFVRFEAMRVNIYFIYQIFIANEQSASKEIDIGRNHVVMPSYSIFTKQN